MMTGSFGLLTVNDGVELSSVISALGTCVAEQQVKVLVRLSVKSTVTPTWLRPIFLSQFCAGPKADVSVCLAVMLSGPPPLIWCWIMSGILPVETHTPVPLHSALISQKSGLGEQGVPCFTLVPLQFPN